MTKKYDRSKKHKFEQVVIGLILSERENLREASTVLSSVDCFSKQHRLIYFAALDFDIKLGSGNDFDYNPLSIGSLLHDNGNLSKIGENGLRGYQYLDFLRSEAPIGGSVIFYTQELLKEHALENILTVTNKFSSVAGKWHKGEYCMDEKEADLNIDSMMSGLITELQAAQSSLVVNKETQTLRSLARKAEFKIEKIIKGEVKPGLDPGVSALKEIVGVMGAGEYIVLGGHPGQGKTALALDILGNTIKDVKSLVFSIEMSGESLVIDRFLPRASKFDSLKLRSDPTGLNSEDFDRLRMGAELLSDKVYDNMRVEDKADPTIGDIEKLCRAYFKPDDELPGLLVVDYLHRIQGDRNYESNQRRIADISTRLANLIKGLNLFSIIIVQLDLKSAKEGSKPCMKDIRDSGVVRQDAHQGWFVFASEEEERQGLTNIVVDKNRNGQTGTRPSFYQRSCSRFGKSPVHQNPDEFPDER